MQKVMDFIICYFDVEPVVGNVIKRHVERIVPVYCGR